MGESPSAACCISAPRRRIRICVCLVFFFHPEQDRRRWGGERSINIQQKNKTLQSHANTLCSRSVASTRQRATGSDFLSPFLKPTEAQDFNCAAETNSSFAFLIAFQHLAAQKCPPEEEPSRRRGSAFLAESQIGLDIIALLPH